MMRRWTGIALSCVLAATALTGCATRPPGEGAGWVMLIDGERGLENWTRIGDANWRGVDGAIQADKRTGKDSSHLLSKNTYKDFQIYAEFWADETANSGIFIRCVDPKKIGANTCYEVNIYDRRPDPSYGTGAIVDFAKVSPMPRAAGRWNTFEITAQGNRLTVKMNGQQTVDIQDGKFASGPITLQYAGGVIKFRKVSIKPL